MVRTAGSLLVALLVLLASPAAPAADHCATGVDGDRLCLPAPAQRIVSLAPHLTEMLFAVGAGERVVGAVAYSDYPEAAREIPEIGGYRGLDLERIVRLQPDLVVAWADGNLPADLERLERLGLTVFSTPGRSFQDVPKTLRQLGRLTGGESQADAAADDFVSRLEYWTARYRDPPRLKGFFEIWPSPLVTVGPRHYISEAMDRCGIDNIVTDGLGDTPTWSEEAVVRAAPDLIITSPPARDLDRWRRWQDLPAARFDGLLVLPADVLMRAGPRLVDGLQALCEMADQVRERQP
ncbi:ABC transporter substrate-binding protein [Thioalkalivibrio paradoxus ARh 1]|uniref:ABC transporter substrate-binding protein n=1 Tax=Thioalkalivibrio paradoxus ARh 1 TaxID=713585 RepID=W0DQU5_9GAMM|nr:ABC transporter substrate-binding protein [Thioalkalivibrio paradoxus ARh 1]